MANIDNLNFKVIIDDKDFNTRVEKDIELAKKLNVELSQLLQAKVKVNAISATEAASAKRASDILTKQATNQEKVSQAKAKTAEAEEKVATQAAKTAKELERGKAAASQTAVNVQRLATEQQRTVAATQNAAAATSRAALAQRRLRDYASQTTNSIRTQSRLMSELKGYALGYLSIHGAAQLISSLVRVTGEFELQKTTLAAMLGDLNQAEQIITRIQGLAVESPFQFKELTTYAKQLSAFSVPAQELYDTTKMLADVSAGLGVGMDRIVLAYGQVRSAAFLRGQEVRQFTEAGIPILEELAKQFTELEGRAVSAGEVFDKISARLVPFEMVAKVFKDMTSEGGKFYEMQEIQAETLRGKLSNLKDAYEMMLNEIGSAHSDKLKGAVDSVRDLMNNWEKIAAVLKTVIVVYGTYKGALAMVWAAEKAITATRSLTYFVTLTERVKTATAAYRAFGVTLKSIKTMGAGLAVGAIFGIITAITTAVRKAQELKNELESIASAEFANSDKLLKDLDAIKKKLGEARQGSQNYRDAISELNRKYSEYLPNLATEADSLDKVRFAADAAALAIRNKAKANAYEKGATKIEEQYGGEIASLTTGVRDILVAKLPDITDEMISDFIGNFNSAIKANKGQVTLEELFNTEVDKYFGYGTSQEFRAIFGGIGDKDLAMFRNLDKYAKTYSEYSAKMEDFEKTVQIMSGSTGYQTKKERETLEALDNWYAEAKEGIDATKLSQSQYNDEIDKLNIAKLRRLVKIYTDLGRKDLAKSYQGQLDELLKVPEGWRGTVQDTLKQMGLTKGTSFGLWAEDTTQSTSYVDDMVKRYKELGEEIKRVSSFDKEQADRLKQNKKAIEEVAKALKIDIKNLSANKSEQTESVEERRIKRLIEALRTLQDQYEKLKAVGVSDEGITTLFKSLYPELIKENGEAFVTDLKYLERALGLVKELESIAPEDAKKILVDLGQDEFSKFYKQQQDQKKAWEDSAKAAGKYYEMLRKYQTGDFNIEGTGTAFDIGKIASDLREKFNEIDLRAKKAGELLSQVDLGSEESIAKVKALFEKEFGEGSWDIFYAEFVKEGEKAFDILAKKEKAYETKVAQERIDSLARAYVSDITSDLDMQDWGDKSLGQIEYIRQELMKLMSADLPISDALKTELAKLGLTTDDLIEKIRELLGGNYNNTIVEKFKKVQDVASEIASTSANLGGAFAQLGESLGSEVLSDAGKLMNTFGEIADILVECDSFMAAISSSMNDAKGEASGVAEELGNVVQSSDWITMIIKLVLLLIQKVADAIATQRKNAEESFQAALEFQKAMDEIARQGSETIFGNNFIKKFTTDLNIATDAANKFHDALNEAMSTNRGTKEFTISINDGDTDLKTFRDLRELLATKQFGSEAEMMEYLKSHIDVFEGWTLLTDGVRTTKQLETEIKELISLYDYWMEANEEVKASLTDLFGQLGSDIANNMINSFIEIGNATANLEESFESLGETILQSFLQSAIIDGVLMPRLEEISELTTAAAGGGLPLDQYADMLGDITADMKGDIENLAPIWEQVMAAFQENGLLPGTESTGTTDLGDGIKGITEDTANLLASYLNAIRADVSYSKTLWMRMDANIQRLADMFVSSPTLMEYQAQIAANTYDTAQATQSILADLRSVITSDSGDTAIRVYS